MHPLLQSLSGGDRRSIGHAGRAVQAVLAHPEWLAVLFEGIEAPDPVLRMRCADAIEKITARRPALSARYHPAPRRVGRHRHPCHESARA